jgi:uncharacterized protein (TIGR03435 family)
MLMEGREAVNRVKGLLTLAILTLAVLRPAALQQTVANPAKAGLEIASITLITSGTTASGGIRFQPKNGELQATGVTLAELVKFAYQRHFFDEREVTGGPAWVTSDRFDLLVRVSGGHVFDADGVPRKTLALLRALLFERLTLKVREEYRDRPVYALTTAGTDGVLGPKARKSNIDRPGVVGALTNRDIAGSGRSDLFVAAWPR